MSYTTRSTQIPSYTNMNQQIKPLIQIVVSIKDQILYLLENNNISLKYAVSTGKKPSSQLSGSGGTPTGKHEICEIIGLGQEKNTIFKSRIPQKEKYKRSDNPSDDYILSRILRLKGLENGVNLGYNSDGHCVDSYDRYIYIHGTPDDINFDKKKPSSHGCIRMHNDDIIELSNIINVRTKVLIQKPTYTPGDF